MHPESWWRFAKDWYNLKLVILSQIELKPCATDGRDLWFANSASSRVVGFGLYLWMSLLCFSFDLLTYSFQESTLLFMLQNQPYWTSLVLSCKSWSWFKFNGNFAQQNNIVLYFSTGKITAVLVVSRVLSSFHFV